jgi:hypothetical protein
MGACFGSRSASQAANHVGSRKFDNIRGAIMASLHVVSVVLGLPSPTLALLLRAHAIVDAMSNNATIFKNPTPVLTVASSHIDDLDSANTLAQSRAKGTASARDEKKAIVIADMHQLHGYVQALANATPAQAEAIALAAAMTLRKPRVTHKSDLAVKHVVSGTVHVIAKATKGSHAYQWQSSADGGKTWTDLPVTLQAHTVVSGLLPGTTVTFRHRAVLKTGATDWGQAVSAIVL